MSEVELDRLRQWLSGRGWTALPHQEETWEAQAAGASGLVTVATGMGKTYAAYLGALARVMESPGKGLRILWITPLRAMTRDIELALRAPVEELGLDLEVGSRTGDTPASRRKKYRQKLPPVLLTTPESLSVMLSYEDADKLFANVDTVVLDEWHELAGSKRGTQTELAVARLRKFAHEPRVWALSATVGNVEELAHAAVGVGTDPVLVTSAARPLIAVESVMGDVDKGLPWFGFFGVTMIDDVVETLDPEVSTLLFTNTRNQAERWYAGIVERRPEWAEHVALHHGSIAVEERRRIEAGLKSGEVTIVVATSSLDLGVDFSRVERVYQIGSPRSVSRLLQRAGRSGHRPDARSVIRVVPTQVMQLVEIEALRRAVEAGHLEARIPPHEPIDVLVQHIITCALGGGVAEDDLFEEVRTAWSYRNLTRERFDWALQFAATGGSSLRSYPLYQRLTRDDDANWRISEPRQAKMHRLGIGTITGQATVRVRFLNGQNLGRVDEDFLSRLGKNDRFVFAGRVLELVRMRNMEAWVKVASAKSGHAPRWSGGRLAVSQPLGRTTEVLLGEIRRALEAGKKLDSFGPEIERAESILALQNERGKLPDGEFVYAEVSRTKEGTHLFLFPFAGQLAHQGIASLLAHRLSRTTPATFALSVNDYGLELLSASRFDFEAAVGPELFSLEGMVDELVESVNAAELGRRQFRQIARVAGLIFTGYPGSRKSVRQVQTSAGLLYDVFARWEPDNMLFTQAREEVLSHQFEGERLMNAMRRMNEAGVDLVRTERPSPLAFPLVVDRVEARLSTETARARLERMKAKWTEDQGA